MERSDAEELLQDFTLEEILEMNDLTEEEVLDLLIKRGLIAQPETFFDRFTFGGIDD